MKKFSYLLFSLITTFTLTLAHAAGGLYDFPLKAGGSCGLPESNKNNFILNFVVIHLAEAYKHKCGVDVAATIPNGTVPAMKLNINFNTTVRQCFTDADGAELRSVANKTANIIVDRGCQSNDVLSGIGAYKEMLTRYAQSPN